MFLRNLAEGAEGRCGLTRERAVLVGVSGGADSLALMIGLQELGFEIIVAHLDHALRPESRADAAYVRKLTKAQGIPFIERRVDVQQTADHVGQSLEEAAREIRYRFLFEEARVADAQAVAVGHHADDQVETVLMHFLRGAGLSGLSGMDYRRVMSQWDAQIPLVRPLLGIWRDQIEEFVAALGLEPRVDATNIDTTYFRNRLRHALIPNLQTYNPQIREVIWRMADVLREDDQVLSALVDEAWEDIFSGQDVGTVELDRHKLLARPLAIQRRVLREAITCLRPNLRDVDFESVERVLTFAAQPTSGGEIDLVGRLKIVLLTDVLIVKTWAADLPDWGKPLLPMATTQATLAVDRPVSLRHGWQLRAKVIETEPENALRLARNARPDEAYLDFERLKTPLQVRGRRAGDRWQPFGMGGQTQKLSDFFINEKIPEHLRPVWPLVFSGEKIVWVVGLRMSDAFKIGAETRTLLHVQLVRVVA